MCGARGYLGNVGGLLLDGDEHVASLVVETLAGVIEADVLDGIADNLLVVKVGLGGDLSEDHDHASLAGSLASDLGIGILSEARIKNRVRHNVAKLVCETKNSTSVPHVRLLGVREHPWEFFSWVYRHARSALPKELKRGSVCFVSQAVHWAAYRER